MGAVITSLGFGHARHVTHVLRGAVTLTRPVRRWWPSAGGPGHGRSVHFTVRGPTRSRGPRPPSVSSPRVAGAGQPGGRRVETPRPWRPRGGGRGPRGSACRPAGGCGGDRAIERSPNPGAIFGRACPAHVRGPWFVCRFFHALL